MALEIISKADAKSAGSKKYFTGKECPKGHLCQRYVSTGQCIECIAAKTKKRAAYFCDWRKANAARFVEYSAAYRRRNPTSGADYMARIRLKKRDELLAAERARYAKNPGKFLAKGALYRAAKPEVYATHARNRRAALKAAEGKHSADEILLLFDMQKGMCACCKVSISDAYHADHIMPLVLGGSNWIDNIQLLCPTCDMKKGALHPAVFASRMGAELERA